MGQGSVLGPLLFLVCVICVENVLDVTAEAVKEINLRITTCKDTYIKDMTSYDGFMTSESYADDLTAVVVTDNEDQNERLLNILSQEYVKYFKSVGLKVNVSKGEHLILSKNRSKQIVVDGRMEAESVKLLGVTFAAGWNFDKHIQNLVARCNFRIANLAKIKPYITVKQLGQLGEALVMSVVRYGLEFLSASEANLTKVSRTG